MPLYHVQDQDREAWVIAESYWRAEAKWREAVKKQNEDCDMGPPKGISIVCDDEDLIIGDSFQA